MRAKYINISIRKELAEEIDELIKTSKLSFGSRASLVTYLFRKFLEGGKS